MKIIVKMEQSLKCATEMTSKSKGQFGSRLRLDASPSRLREATEASEVVINSIIKEVEGADLITLAALRLNARKLVKKRRTREKRYPGL